MSNRPIAPGSSDAAASDCEIYVPRAGSGWQILDDNN